MSDEKKRIIELIVDPSSSEEFQSQTKPRTYKLVQEQTQTKARTMSIASPEQANAKQASNSQAKEKTSKTEKSEN